MKFTMNDAWDGEATPCITVLPSGLLVRSCFRVLGLGVDDQSSGFRVA